MSDEPSPAMGFTLPYLNCDDRSPGKMRALLAAIVGLIAAIILASTGPAVAQGSSTGATKKILVIYADDSTLPAVEVIRRGMSQVFRKEFGKQYNLYTEYLDLVRFPSAEREHLLSEDLIVKYASTHLDVIIAAGPLALQFVLAHRDRFAPQVPVIYGAVTRDTVDALSPPPDVKGIVNHFDVLKTLDLARKLQPDAKKVIIITGSAKFDRRWESMARQKLGSAGVEVQYISGLTLEGFEEVVRALPSNAIVIVLTVFRDVAGRQFVPAYVTTQIAKASAAPVYSVYDTAIGDGIVGGSVQPFEDMGREMAGLALKAIADPTSVPSIISAQERPIIDWRQLKRWNIPDSRIPPTAEVRYRKRSTLERYVWQITAVLMVLLLQAVTIAALVIERRLRNKMQKELMEERLALEHTARVSQLGELSGAFAHELNQPLTSILANAEAGAKLLQADRPDYAEIQEIINDIISNTNRSADFIRNLRGLFSKGGVELEIFDINTTVESVIRLTHSTIITSGTKISFKRTKATLHVAASMVQMQHVVLNLVLNAVDAMSTVTPSGRTISITSRLRDDGFRELAVEDSGPGLPQEMISKAFKPFVTTKTGGLGLGLAICHTIVTAYGGTLSFEENRKVGARVVLALPPPPGANHGTVSSSLSGR